MNSPDLSPVLYAASAAALADEPLFAAALAAVSPERQEKVQRLRFDRDRRLSLAAGILLRHALRAAGVPYPAAICRGAQGKPYLAGQGIHFNLSHAGEWAVCAVAPCPIGCDVEQIRPVEPALAKRFFCPEEQADIACQPTPEARYDRFFRYWTLKESFLKATGLGLSLPLNAFTILPEQTVSVIQSVDGYSYHFTEYTQLSGYRCALCAAEELPHAPLRIVELSECL